MDPRLERIAEVLAEHRYQFALIESRPMCPHHCSAACAVVPCEAYPERHDSLRSEVLAAARRILDIMEEEA